MTRDYECSNAKLSSTLGFIPTRSVAMAITDLLDSIDATDRTMLTDPRHYNIRWLELMHEVTPGSRSSARSSDAGVASSRPVLIMGGGAACLREATEDSRPSIRSSGEVRSNEHRRHPAAPRPSAQRFSYSAPTTYGLSVITPAATYAPGALARGA